MYLNKVSYTGNQRVLYPLPYPPYHSHWGGDALSARANWLNRIRNFF